VFFWSEEHARAYRQAKGGETGTYMTLAQCAYANRVLQSALFGYQNGHQPPDRRQP
jgi:transcriptional regulator of acetoin/glycerol metabolism